MNALAERLSIAVLALLAILTGWWLWRLQQRAAPAPAAERPAVDYRLEDFDLAAYNQRGIRSFSVRAPRLERETGEGRLRIERPRIELMDARERRWRVAAGSARVTPDGERLDLEGGVELERADGGEGALRLATDSLAVWPESQRLAAPGWVTIEQPGSILRGRGLEADLSADRFQLLAETHATFRSPAR